MAEMPTGRSQFNIHNTYRTLLNSTTSALVIRKISAKKPNPTPKSTDYNFNTCSIKHETHSLTEQKHKTLYAAFDAGLSFPFCSSCPTM